MSVYPHNLTAEGAPTDRTGSYPAVAGYTPMGTGRRVAIVLVDLVIAAAVGGLAAYLAGVDATWALPVLVAVSVVYVLASLVALFARSARLAGVLMNAQYVDVRTGRLSGGRLLAKQLLQSLLAALSAGILPTILVFSTVHGPMRRNWFDRTTGLMLVDGRTGRRPGSPVEAPGAPQEGRNVAPVRFDPQAAPTAWGGQGVSAYEFPAVSSVTSDGGLITAVPGAPVRQPVQPPSSSPSSPVASPPPLAVHEPRRPEAADHPSREPDHTILKPSLLEGSTTTGTTPEITLDGEHPLLVTPPVVFGRNPAVPGSHPDAVPHPLEDSLISKTHLLMGRDEDGVWVIDLHSTNGTSVTRVADTEPAPVMPGRKVRLPEGSSVHFGRHRITIGGRGDG